MLAKLRRHGGKTFARFDPDKVNCIIESGDDPEHPGPFCVVETESNHEIVAGTADEVEAELAKARRIKITTGQGPVYIAANGSIVIETAYYEGDDCCAVRVMGEFYCPNETRAEVLAQLGWAE
jgi:hypothetical protein